MSRPISYIGSRLQPLVRGLTLLLALAALTACDDALAWPTTAPAAQPSAPAPVETALPATNGAPDDAADSPQLDNRQLVVWLPDFSGLAGEDSAGDILAATFHQFEQTHPGIRIDVQVKAASGPADLFSYLRSAQRVAPSILPDVVLINTQALWQLADLGLALPIPAEQAKRAGDFYQFSLDAVAYQGQAYGVPYAADVLHLAAQDNPVEQTPATWSNLFADGQPYWFAAAGGDLYQNGSVLMQYVGAGGQLLEDGSTSSEEALQAVFDFLVEGRMRNVIPTDVAETATLDAVWTRLAGPGPALGNVTAATYLANREVALQMQFGQLPTRNGLPATLASTWAFAVLTQDEELRGLAFGLVDALLEPEVQGAWSQYSHRLPTRRSALHAWTSPTPYIDFLNRQMDVAVALPNGRAFADFAHRLQDAQRGVILGELTPDAAVQMVSAPE